MLAIAMGAGFSLEAGDDGLLAAHGDASMVRGLPNRPYVVVHPGAHAPARTYPAEHFTEVVRLLATSGTAVVVTGSNAERPLTAIVAGIHGYDFGGRLDLAELAGVLGEAEVVVAGNTGPAHLAAAVRTPIVSLFAPVVPAVRWAPFGTPVLMLGDQRAPCRDTRAVQCPIAGHPCLAGVRPADVVQAVRDLAPIGAAKREVTA
jgi:ADP-heptose:LPS heptosyltransferase